MSNSSDHDEKFVRYRADELPPPDPEELERIRRMRDDDIDFSDIPPLFEPSSGTGGDVVVWLRLDPETFESLRRHRITSDELRELVRKHLAERTGDAA